MKGKVYIVILNYTRGWKHTVECLESVFRNNYKNFQVIVVDDSSQDNGLLQIKNWADGNLEINISDDNPLKPLTFPPVPKKIEFIEFLNADFRNLNEVKYKSLILIQSTLNRGFAGANNLGLKFALAKNDFDYVWLLNNDTVIKPDALSQLVTRMEKGTGVGMCGSTLLFYDNPNIIQTLGGSSFNVWSGIGKQLEKGQSANTEINAQTIEKKIDYVYAASILISKEFIERTGLMSEDYFIYFEEIDWIKRAKGKFSLTYAPKSIVYHKAGATIGGDYTAGGKNSSFSDYYYIKNMLRFSRRFYPWAAPTVFARILIIIFQKLKGRQWTRAWLIAKILLGILYKPLDPIQTK